MAITSKTTDAAREVAPALPQVFLRYAERALGSDGLQRAARRTGLGMSVAALMDKERWFSGEEATAIIDAVARVCGDPEIGRRAGEQLLHDSIRGGIHEFIVATGSVVAAAHATCSWGTKMSTNRTLRVVEDDERQYVVEAKYADASLAHPAFCDLTAGYNAQLPSLFGYTGTCVETECEHRGDAACRYVVRWVENPLAARPDVGQSADRSQRVIERFEELQAMAADLSRAEDLPTVLARITQRAGLAVQAPRYLLAVRAGDHEPLHVHHSGFRSDAQANAYAERLIAGESFEGRHAALVVEVESSSRRYGYLAALFPPDATVHRTERRLLAAYAGHAAAALDAVESLESARRDRDTAQALLELAGALAHVVTPEEMSQRLAAAVPMVTGCDVATVWVWDAQGEAVSLAAWHDAAGETPSPGPERLTVEELPGLEAMVRTPHPVMLAAEDAPDVLRPMYAATGVIRTGIVPIAARGGFLGLVTAGFRGPASIDDDSRLFERLAGLAGQAATALDNARLVERMRHQALHDSLTGLPNRPLIEDRANQALRQARRTGTGICLLFLDLDRFKNVNDTLGHSAGDELIKQVAHRFRSAMRTSDTLGRLGGDEFVVLLPDATTRVDGVAVAKKLIESLAEPFHIADQNLFISCSIGIAAAPEDGDDYETLMQHADAAMYEAKAHGRNTYAVPAAGPGAAKRELLDLESRLHLAVDNDELAILYQPQIDLQTMRIIGVEALVRWDHPVLGRLAPAAFLPVAEESGVIVAIDEWVRRRAFAQARQWQDGGAPLRVAVNLSTRDLRNPTLVKDLAEAINASGADPRLIELEVTDRVVMSDDDLPAVLEDLRTLGVRLAIDDFGTGNSVLGRLQRCPIDTLKIDRSFVSEITRDANEAPIVRALLSLAASLELDVVAEGVETATQGGLLRRYGCQVAQGYLFSPPIDADAIDGLVQRPF